MEGTWARNLVARVGVPSARKEQESLDISRLFAAVALWNLRKEQKALSSESLAQLILMVRDLWQAGNLAPESGREAQLQQWHNCHNVASGQRSLRVALTVTLLARSTL